MPVVLTFFLTPWGQFIAAVVLLALARTTSAWYGSASGSANAGGIQSAVISILTAPLRAIGGVAHKIVSTTVSHWAAAHVKIVARWFLHANLLVSNTYKAHGAFAETTAHAFERLRTTVIPREIKRLTGPIGARATRAVKAADVARAEERANHRAFERYRSSTLPKIATAYHASTVVLPGEIGRIRTREDTLSRDQTKLRERTDSIEHGAIKTWEWIRTHPLSAATGLFAGAVAVALSRLGWGVLRCRSWQNLGRSLKCSDAAVLADLLAAATLAVGVMSIVELAREEQKVIGEAAKLIRGFWEL
jgi:hypothetical protein